MRWLLTVLAVILYSVPGQSADAKETSPATSVARNPIDVDPAEYLHRIQLPPGFSIAIYAAGVSGARSMVLGDSGTVFVGTRVDSQRQTIGKVYALTNPDGDGTADRVITLVDGLNMPNGVAFLDGDLYVAEIHRILRFKDIQDNLDVPPVPDVVGDSFPNERHHGWKHIGFGPDGRLYIPVGAPCNTCEPAPGQGVIVSMRPDGTDRRTEVLGVRNSVGFDWHPETGELWFTDNGRDLWGDDIPPEELNRVTELGQHFGFPYHYGRGLVDEDYSTNLGAADFSGPAVEFPAHNALLSVRFYRGEGFPETYRGDALIASHGSWNRDPPDGYKIYRLKMRGGEMDGYEEFATGWLTDEHQYWGRPVDLLVMPDGSLLVSDDHAGVIYRISYKVPVN